jgi:hypothetical protein
MVKVCVVEVMAPLLVVLLTNKQRLSQKLQLGNFLMVVGLVKQARKALENLVTCQVAAQGLQMSMEELFERSGMKGMTSMRLLLEEVTGWRVSEAGSGRWIAMF